MNKLKILIVDDEPDLLEFIALFVSNAMNVELLKFSSSLAAVEKINSIKSEIALIISDFNMPKVNGGKLFEIARTAIPNVPFLLLTSDPQEKHQNILSQTNTSYVSKPFTENQINQAVKSLLQTGTPESPTQYIPISIECLFLIHKIKKPLFAKLDDKQFNKVIDTEIEFDETSYENYKSKGTHELYVEKEHFQSLIEEFKEKTITTMRFNKLTPPEAEAVKLTSNVVGLLSDTVKAFGFDQKTQVMIKKNLEMVKYLSNTTSEINKLFKWNDATEKEYSAHHSLLISCITTAICKEYQFKNPNASEILAMAAFFHDMTMDSYIIKNEVRFIKAMKLKVQTNKDEINIVKNHPVQAHLALKDWKDCPPEVMNIVLHHHELPNGSGFPDGLKADQIDELTACFIMAEELVELYLNKKAKGLVLKYMQMLDSEYNKDPYKPFYKIIINWLSNKNLAL